MAQQAPLTGKERTFPADEIIVSKTDRTGRLTYVNDVFLDVSGYTEAELLGQPHSLIRHPAMPRCVFKILWDHIGSGREVFAYVNNVAKNGDNYWVFAHVTPNLDEAGEIVGFHSNRRVPRREAVRALEPVYAKLLAEEARFEDRKQGMLSAHRLLLDTIGREGKTYDEFVLGL